MNSSLSVDFADFFSSYITIATRKNFSPSVSHISIENRFLMPNIILTREKIRERKSD